MSFASSGAGTATTAPLKAGFAQTGLDAINAAPRLTGITTNIPMLDMAATGIGSINIDLGRDEGVARQIPLLWSDGTRLYPSLAVETLRVAQGADTLLLHASPDTENAIDSLVVGDLEIALSESGMFHVYYRPNTKDLYVSAASVISGKERDKLRPLIEGNVVLVGTSAVGLLDVRTSALGEAVPGVSVHAQAIEQILSGTYLTRPEWAVGIELLFMAGAGLLLILLTGWLRPWNSLLAFAIIATAVVGATVASFRGAGILLDATYPILSLGLVFLSSIAMKLLVTDKQGRQMRGAFAQYVAPAVLGRNRAQPPKPQTRRRDARRHRHVCGYRELHPAQREARSCQPCVRRQPRCSTLAARPSSRNRAPSTNTSAMPSWPSGMPRSRWRTISTTPPVPPLASARRWPHSMKSLICTRCLTERGAPRLAVRVGLASGPACVGNMGSSERFDYSVLGETVNTAARTEATCKSIGHDIAIAGTLQGRTSRPCHSLCWQPAHEGQIQGGAGPHHPRRRSPRGQRKLPALSQDLQRTY